MSKGAVAALSAVVVLLLAYVLMFERTSITSKELSERKGRVLTSFVREKVDRLEIERQSKRVVLEKKANDEGELRGWRMLAPVAAEADEDVIDQVLGELEWLSARRTLDSLSAEDEKRFGLSAPRYRVTYGTAGSRHLLEVGGEDVHGESVYVRLDHAARAYVVPKTLLDVLKRDPGEFRDKQLLADLTVAWARKLVVTRADGKSELEKQGEHWWLATAPRGFGDSKRIEELLQALADLRAVRYVEPGELLRAEAALRAPALRLDVNVVPDSNREDQAPRALGLVVGGTCEGHEGELFARTLPDGAPVCMRKDDLHALAPSDTELRELRLFAADPSAVERFELARGTDKLAAQRDGEKWKGDGAAFDREAVEAWLRDLSAARATSFASATPFTEQGSLTLTLVGGKRERVTFGGLGASDEFAVKRGDEPLLLSFPASTFDRLQPSKSLFASLEPWSRHQPSEVQLVEARDEGRVRVLRLQDGSWQAPDAGSAGSERARLLVRRLIDLRVHAHVSDALRPAHGISSTSPRVVLTLTRGSLSLELGAPTSVGAYARVDGRAVVEVERDIVGILRELAGGPPAALAPEKSAAPADELDHGDHEDHDEHGDHEHGGHEH